ncbi:MAG: type IV pilus modification PilV family protein [Planctomycetota bacterium]|jgi:prepilin-type N-terminal cleavage/methylation domain-containing protein
MIRSRHHGFTLIETIAAIVILAVALPPMLYAVREAHLQRVAPVQASTARWLAVEKLEDIIADRHSTTRGYDYLIPANYTSETPVSGFGAYERSVTLTETLADLTTAGDGYMKVTVIVSWTDATGAARSLSISTVLTEYDG